ncbi:MAG: hypothetical protein HYY01_14585 [Chloroflexi bacterium]|nr:hypothetical protein [Chloroflexota bacterium]
MIYWAQLLHFYQPATQLHSVLDKVCEESYGPLLDVFRQHPHARATVNINGVLTEMLEDHGQGHIVQGLRELANRGQIEFTGSAKYHCILPLVPGQEARRQIELNARTNSYFLGDAYKPAGFFPPEMAYDRSVLAPVLDSGHRWIIVSGVACPANWPVDQILWAEHAGKRLPVFFRDDILSNKISFQELGPRDFLSHLQALNHDKRDTYVVTAMDAETYGHHIKNWEELFLAEVYEQIAVRRQTYAGIRPRKALPAEEASLLVDLEATHQVQSVTVSQLLELFPAGPGVDPKPSSWSTSAEDIEAGVPYPLWAHNGNEVHRLQWEHMTLCLQLCSAAGQHADNEESKHFAGIARGLLDRALQSDQFWWASRRPMWDINLIHVGLIDQWRAMINAYRALNVSGASGETKRDHYYKAVAARDIRDKIVDRLFVV